MNLAEEPTVCPGGKPWLPATISAIRAEMEPLSHSAENHLRRPHIRGSQICAKLSRGWMVPRVTSGVLAPDQERLWHGSAPGTWPGELKPLQDSGGLPP